MSGLQFDWPLYAPVYEHLARAFARPSELRLPAALYAGESDALALPKTLHRELLRRIKAAEAAYQSRLQDSFDPYANLPSSSGRPALTSSKTDKKLVELFLG